jgi:flagellar motor switch protein FliM
LSQGWLAYQRRAATEDKTEDLARALGATHVNVVAYLAETKITVDELLTLAPGDIIQTTKSADGEIILQVEGENKFAGKIGRNKDNLATKVTRSAEVEEPL